MGWGEWTGGATATLSLPRLPPIFFSSSLNAEPGPRLQKMEKQNNKETEKKCRINSVKKQYCIVCIELYVRPFCIYLVACSFLTSTQMFCLNDDT